MNRENVLVVIPARYGSSRFPGKPLAKIGGVEMIVRVCRRVAEGGWNLLVATDDRRILDAVETNGFKGIMTRPDHPSGTDRVEEAVALSGLRPEVVINVQGDEPFIDTTQLESLADCFDDPAIDIATLVRPFPKDGAYSELADPSLVKVVTADNGCAIYFSRSVIPYRRGEDTAVWPASGEYKTHVGVYAYRRDVLGCLTGLKRSQLEVAESLEQLRWLQAGYRIATRMTIAPTIGIDTPADLEAAEKFLTSQS